jgi:hypothetical protein
MKALNHSAVDASYLSLAPSAVAAAATIVEHNLDQPKVLKSLNSKIKDRNNKNNRNQIAHFLS